MRAPLHATNVPSPAASVRGPGQLVSAAGVDHKAICECRLAPPVVARLSRVSDHEGTARREPFAAHTAIPFKPALHHVPPTTMPRAVSEKVDAANHRLIRSLSPGARGLPTLSLACIS